MGVSLPSAGRSWFVRLFAGDAGIDPYTRAVSDVYQDLFQEGSFIGKGIYDVDAFERALAGRFPENTVLSHDLMEACPCPLAPWSATWNSTKNIRPATTWTSIGATVGFAAIGRSCPWLLPRVPGADARRIANPLSALSRWKIFDNLRRSLVPVALLLFLLGNWLLVPELGGLGPLLVLAIIALPGLLSVLVELLRKPKQLPWAMHLRGVGASGGRQLGQISLTLAFLPYDAFISLDAIGRTLLRMLVTRKRLLEWQTSSDAERDRRARISPAFMPRCGSRRSSRWRAEFAWHVMQPAQLPLALPLLGLWLAAPWIAWWISQPIEPPAPDLTAEQLTFLRRTARKTWHFFETFVTAQENWLPPDNFQEEPFTGDGRAHLAHEHRAGAAGQPGGAGFWLSVVRPT